ncbi:hypothetical protein RhiXN_06959 [Rhizoctonia solani]|uniref:Uncharacterized protein n=1 Tax=Rhizoctonia solani TaxID=456999 RepID=A0A8H8P4I2_9AGAM|nr:uncharacterized protein RhiXN_06959 [Rhizoctonia solani]QRW25010.1 hypothetical protein RhiXN_06959 [Rhizoctonia solani]
MKDIVYLSRSSDVFNVLPFADINATGSRLREHTERMVNQLASALKNERLSQDTNTRKSLEELRKTLEDILHKMFRVNSSHGAMFRLRRAMFPEEDYTQVAHMRQQLNDALALFNLATNCELLARVPPYPNPLGDTCRPSEKPASRPSEPLVSHSMDCGEKSAPSTVKPTLTGDLNIKQLDPHVPQCDYSPGNRPPRRRSDFVASGTENDGLLAADAERRPLLAMDLAIALSHYSELLVKSGCTADALAASQESARLFRSLAEKGPEVYHDAY